MSHQPVSPSPALETQRRSGARDSIAPEEIDSQLLLGSGKRILIRHRGQTYQLRETRQGKLILTK